MQPDGTKVYTPFPEYEESIKAGVSTQRRHYTLAGLLIAVRVYKDATDNKLYFAFADHLGSIAAWTNSAGNYIGNSTSRYEPYGGYRTKPVAGVNPDISDRGFTGHRQNNTGTYDLGLIYMNARYYMPEIGRFISADTIVPEPERPQGRRLSFK